MVKHTAKLCWAAVSFQANLEKKAAQDSYFTLMQSLMTLECDDATFYSEITKSSTFKVGLNAIYRYENDAKIGFTQDAKWFHQQFHPDINAGVNHHQIQTGLTHQNNSIQHNDYNNSMNIDDDDNDNNKDGNNNIGINVENANSMTNVMIVTQENIQIVAPKKNQSRKRMQLKPKQIKMSAI